jgi:hypothetical protein
VGTAIRPPCWRKQLFLTKFAERSRIETRTHAAVCFYVHMRSLIALGLGIAVCAATSCGGTAHTSGFGGEGSSSGGGSSGGGSGSGGSSGGTIGSFGDAGGGGTTQGCPPCNTLNVNIANSGCDLDCSGSDNPPSSCDQGLPYDGPAADFAKALGLCQQADATHWGVVSATYTQGYNSTQTPNDGQHGIMAGFGTNVKPREGANLGILSSGWALPCDDQSPGANCSGSGESDPYFKGEQTPMDPGLGTPPPGYPKSTAQCQAATDIHDTIGVTLQIKTPANAQGLSYDFDFYSGEWPEYVCTSFNDSFVAWLQSAAWSGTNGDLNISFDSKGNPVNVNIGFFNQCTPNTQTGCSGGPNQTAACSGGPTDLQGTGFYNLGTYCTSQSTGGGATGWLTTTAPVKGGETITLQFIIWDTGDANWDSSVLVDNLQWYGTTQTTGTSPAQ